MNSKHIQQNGRAVIVFLLVVFILTIAVFPVLALEDAGGGASRQKPVALNDDEMGNLSLKVTQRTSVAPGAPAIVEVDDEETRGYFSLDGAHYAETTNVQATRVQANDDGMGFLSLKVTNHPVDTSEMSELAQGQ